MYINSVISSNIITNHLLSDPQTNGGLLISVEPKRAMEFSQLLVDNNLKDFSDPIGILSETPKNQLEKVIIVD